MSGAGARTAPTSPRSPAWPASTRSLLLLVGTLLALTMFLIVLKMPGLVWHPARDLELQATYDTYQETGVLLIKHTGTGSWYTQAPSPGKYSAAAWDDDPGSYVIASLMSHVTGSSSPYPGLTVVQGLLIGLPLVWLPLAVARIFGRARAGYVLVFLPAVMWLVNKGTLLTGTEYGLADTVSTVRVYALYGIAASMTFLSLSLLLLLITQKLGLRALIAVTVAFGVLGGIGNLMRALSGVPVCAAVAVLWWLNRDRFKLGQAIAGVLAALVIAFGLQLSTMSVLNNARAEATGQAVSELPVAHGTWHPLYLGLAFPEPVAAGESPFGIKWSDEFGWNVALAQDPDVVIASYEYDQYLKTAYLDVVRDQPLQVAKLYATKVLFTIKEFAAMIVVAGIGFGAALRRAGPHRRYLWATLAIAAPVFFYGFVPTVLVMPMLYYYADLAASLGLLVAVALGALTWVSTSLPARMRTDERRRLAGRLTLRLPEPTSQLSVVVPTRNGATTLPETLAKLGDRLGPDDEILVVENGSTDNTADVLADIAASWAATPQLVPLCSEPGLGNAIRTGVLASTGHRLLLTADDLPFGFTDLDQFGQLADDVVVAIGSKAHPDSNVQRGKLRDFQSLVFRSLRNAILQSSVGDSQGTFWVDGTWARNFAFLSRETGLLWTTELVLAAEQQGIDVVEVPVTLEPEHATVSSRFRIRDGLQSVIGFARLAVYKDDYQDEEWRIGHVITGPVVELCEPLSQEPK